MWNFNVSGKGDRSFWLTVSCYCEEFCKLFSARGPVFFPLSYPVVLTVKKSMFIPLFVFHYKYFIFLIFIIYFLFLASSCISITSAELRPTVRIQQGLLKGKIMTSRNGKEFAAYLGIPYAEPPVKNLRLMVSKKSARRCFTCFYFCGENKLSSMWRLK